MRFTEYAEAIELFPATVAAAGILLSASVDQNVADAEYDQLRDIVRTQYEERLNQCQQPQQTKLSKSQPS